METVSFCCGNCLFLLWKQIRNSMVYNKLVIYRAKYQSFLNEKWRGKITRHHIYTLHNWLITNSLNIKVTRWWDKYYFPNEKKYLSYHMFSQLTNSPCLLSQPPNPPCLSFSQPPNPPCLRRASTYPRPPPSPGRAPTDNGRPARCQVLVWLSSFRPFGVRHDFLHPRLRRPLERGSTKRREGWPFCHG